MDYQRYRELYGEIFAFSIDKGLEPSLMNKPLNSTLEEVLECAEEMRHTYADYLVDKLKFKAVIWYYHGTQLNRFEKIYNHLVNNFGLKPTSTWLRFLKPYDLVWFHRELDAHGANDLAQRIRDGYATLQIPTFSPASAE